MFEARAKLKKNPTYTVEGYYFKHQVRTLHPVGDKLTDDDLKHCLVSSGFSDWGMPKPIGVHEILIETLELNTGLADKDGKKIWTNDELICAGVEGTFKVKWEAGQFIAATGLMDPMDINTIYPVSFIFCKKKEREV